MRRVVVGGVSQLYQGDLDLGRIALERLGGDDLGEDVLLEDFSYGAVAVAQRLQDLRPDKLVLVGAAERGRPPGAVERTVAAPALSPAEIQAAVADAVTGYVGVDLVVAVAHGFGVLPAETVVVEVEPAETSPSEALTAVGERALEEALQIVRAEVRRLRGDPGSAAGPRPVAPAPSR